MKHALLLVMSAAALGACVKPTLVRDSQIAPEPVWQAVLVPAAGHTVHGTVTVLPLDGGGAVPRSRVTVSIAGAAPGASHAWHIHRGLCGSDGPIVGRASMYTPVPTGSAGAAQLMAEMPIRLRSGGSYFAHVHDVAAKGVEACGALREGGAGVVAKR